MYGQNSLSVLKMTIYTIQIKHLKINYLCQNHLEKEFIFGQLPAVQQLVRSQLELIWQLLPQKKF